MSGGLRRSRLTTAMQLYGSPVAAYRAAVKGLRILARRGPAGLWAAAHRKLRQPTLPVDAAPTEDTVAFEPRWLLAGGRASARHSVTIVILSRDQSLIDPCLASLQRSLDPEAAVDVVVVSNGGDIVPRPVLGRRPLLLSESRAFNWSAYNNRAAAESAGEYLLFLNDDVEALCGGWLDVMVNDAIHRSAGAVGARLLYPDGRVQHCGVRIASDGMTDHLHRLSPRAHAGADGGPCVGARTVRAVTGACLLTPRAAFAAVGGFDERFAYGYNDVTYCLALEAAGRGPVVVADAELIHRESVTRPIRVDAREQRLFLGIVAAAGAPNAGAASTG